MLERSRLYGFAYFLLDLDRYGIYSIFSETSRWGDDNNPSGNVSNIIGYGRFFFFKKHGHGSRPVSLRNSQGRFPVPGTCNLHVLCHGRGKDRSGFMLCVNVVPPPPPGSSAQGLELRRV